MGTIVHGKNLNATIGKIQPEIMSLIEDNEFAVHVGTWQKKQSRYSLNFSVPVPVHRNNIELTTWCNWLSPNRFG
jgi:hypothetical protein